MDKPVIIFYKGKDRNGVARGGAASCEPAELIKRLFREGWLWAIAERHGVEVGGIGFDEETGRNVWWAEGATPPPAEAGRMAAEDRKD